MADVAQQVKTGGCRSAIYALSPLAYLWLSFLSFEIPGSHSMKSYEAYHAKE